jgi:ABC-type branched-subunit amino acid transport system substrate-binding protein
VAAPRVAEAPRPPTRTEQPNYFRLRNTPPGVTPVRVAMLLPFTNASADTRAVAEALERAAELALFDSGNADVILMPRDDGGTPQRAAAAAAKAIDDGAEIILGPLFAPMAVAVGPVARPKGVPVIAFSSDRSVGGNGVYLLSFQSENEVRRIISYAAHEGHSAFAAMVPQGAYGDVVRGAFTQAVMSAGGAVTTIQTFPEKPEAVSAPARAAAGSGADAILIADGGVTLQAIGPALVLGGADGRNVKFLGTGLWDDAGAAREPALQGGWFAAPDPQPWRQFVDRYRAAYNSAPPRIATLAYDAVSLVALLSKGQPYQRFTPATLTDPNGFAGLDGIFRFRSDGSADRGLAVLQVMSGGFTTVDPAPKTFQAAGF